MTSFATGVSCTPKTRAVSLVSICESNMSSAATIPLIDPPRDTEAAKTAKVVSNYTFDGPNQTPAEPEGHTSLLADPAAETRVLPGESAAHAFGPEPV